MTVRFLSSFFCFRYSQRYLCRCFVSFKLWSRSFIYIFSSFSGSVWASVVSCIHNIYLHFCFFFCDIARTAATQLWSMQNRKPIYGISFYEYFEGKKTIFLNWIRLRAINLSLHATQVDREEKKRNNFAISLKTPPNFIGDLLFIAIQSVFVRFRNLMRVTCTHSFRFSVHSFQTLLSVSLVDLQRSKIKTVNCFQNSFFLV